MLEDRRLLSVSPSPLAGSHSVAAVSSGDSNFSPSTRAPLTRAAVNLTFAWSLPEHYGLDVKGNDTGLANAVLNNTEAYVNPTGYTLQLDASATTSSAPIDSWNWTVTANNGASQPKQASGQQTEIPNLPQGQYTVQLTITAAGEQFSASQQVTVRDILIVAIGDSYSSGEGNPDHAIPTPGAPSAPYAEQMWAEGGNASMTEQNTEAHRSTLAPSSQAAYNLWNDLDHHVSVTFVMLSTSGASMLHGLFGSTSGTENPHYRVPAQLLELGHILGGRRPDIMTVSIGGNDLGFSPDLAKLLTASSNSTSAVNRIESRISVAYQKDLPKLEANYAKLADYLTRHFQPHDVIETDYADFALGSSGLPVAWGYDLAGLPPSLAESLGLYISQQKSEFISNLILKTDSIMGSCAARNDWQFVDVLGAFSTHGYGASVPWFNSMTAALARSRAARRASTRPSVC